MQFLHARAVLPVSLCLDCLVSLTVIVTRRTCGELDQSRCEMAELGKRRRFQRLNTVRPLAARVGCGVLEPAARHPHEAVIAESSRLDS